MGDTMSKKRSVMPKQISFRRSVGKAEEVKCVDAAGGGSPAISGVGSINFDYDTPVIQLLNGIAAGTDFYQRVGRKVRLRSLYIRGDIYAADNGTTGALAFRVALVYDEQTNGAAPAYSDIFQGVDASGNVGSRAYCGVNLNNRDRFKILYDHWVTMNANTYTAGALVAGSPTIKHLKVYKKISSDIIFSGTANTIGSIATGGLYLVTVSAVNLVSNIAAETRVRFIDN